MPHQALMGYKYPVGNIDTAVSIYIQYIYTDFLT
eukprot:SAG31_NODE_9381_length_1287_cov_1.683502_1_plen_33_part_10